MTGNHPLACKAFLIIVLLSFSLVDAGAAESGGEVERLGRELAELKKAVRGIEEKTRQSGIQVGREIYRTTCRPCHGLNGDGRGHGAKRLNPRPRDFRSGVYKWRTTPFGELPTDEDLDRTIRQGVSGTEMIPFGQLMSRKNRRAVIQYIKAFSPAFQDPARQADRKAILPIPNKRPSPKSTASIAAGRALYLAKGCVACHGAEGNGEGPAAGVLRDAWGDPIKPWDFTKGYYKSGRTEFDLYRTIATGLNGTPMPSFIALTTEQERWQLIDYITSLAEPRKGLLFSIFSAEPTGVVYED